MPNNSMEGIPLPERGAVAASDNTKPLVSLEDMARFSTTIAQGSRSDNISQTVRELEFSPRSFAGYDALKSDYKSQSPVMSENGKVFGSAYDNAIKSPEKPVPSDFSAVMERNVDSIAKGVENNIKAYENSYSEPGYIKRIRDSYKEIEESLNKVLPKDMDKVLAAVNEKLKLQGVRVQLVPGTNALWIGDKGDPDFF